MTRVTVTRKVNVLPNAIPAYVPTTPFHSRALSGVYAPSNGNVTWPQAATAEWQANPVIATASYHLPNVTNYSGGFSDPANRLLFAHGGGHGDGAYNGILQFDLKGSSVPTGWTVVSGSASTVADTPSTLGVNHETYLDGKAGSIHSYDNLHFDAVSNRLIRIGGAYWVQGTGSKDWTFDFDSGQWVAPAARGFSYTGADLATIHDPETRKALVIRQNTARFFNAATDSWSVNKAAPGASGYHYHGAFDPTRNRALFLGGADYAKRHAIVDFSAETVASWTSFTATGDTAVLNDEGYATFYDALLDRFWLFGGRSVAFDKLYWIEAADFSDNAVTVYSQALGGAGAIPHIGTGDPGRYFGLFKRFCYMPDWRAVAVATSYNQPVYIIKLPS